MVVRTRDTEPFALERLDPGAEPEVDAVGSRAVTIETADLGAEDALVRSDLRVDDRHVEARLAGRRSELRADPARTDDCHAGARHEALA